MTKLKKKQAELEVMDYIFNTLEYRENDWRRELERYTYEMDEDGNITKKKKQIEPNSWEARQIEELTAKLEAVDAITEYLEKRI